VIFIDNTIFFYYRSLARASIPARITSVTTWSRRIGPWWWNWRSSSRSYKRIR